MTQRAQNQAFRRPHVGPNYARLSGVFFPAALLTCCEVRTQLNSPEDTDDQDNYSSTSRTCAMLRDRAIYCHEIWESDSPAENPLPLKLYYLWRPIRTHSNNKH